MSKLLTPKQKIERTVLKAVLTAEGIQENGLLDPDFDISSLIDEYDGDYRDTLSEFRYGEYKTGLDCESTRNYEVEGVAARMLDGSYVGWKYYFGGGKHSNPKEIDWMSDAYNVNRVDEEKLVIVTTWVRDLTSSNHEV